MLRGVSLELCRRGFATSVLARGLTRLQEMQEEAAGSAGSLHPLPADYRNPAALQAALDEAVRSRGPIRLAVVWIHREAAEAPGAVADRVHGDYFHVLPGSAAVLPGHRIGPSRLEDQSFRLRYHEIFLGFKTEADRPRWLTHEEICQGVLEAIDHGLARHVVGKLS